MFYDDNAALAIAIVYHKDGKYSDWWFLERYR